MPLKARAVYGLLVTAVCMPYFSFAQCDRIEGDFFKSVADMKEYSKESTLVVIGKIKKLRTVYPHRKPNEMDVEVLSVVDGQWTSKTLKAERGSTAENITFENYVPGKKYLLAFYKQKDDDGYILSQSICGTYSLPMAQ